MAAKRELTPKQRAALDAGRKKREAQNAVKRANKARSKLGASVSRPPTAKQREAQAAVLPDHLPAPLTGAVSLPDSLATPSAAPQVSNAAEDDAIEFDFGGYGDVPEPGPGDGVASDPERGEESSGFLGAVLGRLRGAGDRIRQAGERYAEAQGRQEADVQSEAEGLATIAGPLVMLLFQALVGDDLAPDEETADAMVLPLLRIAVRHTHVSVNPDLRDASEALVVTALYLKVMLPMWQAKRAEARVLLANQLRAAPQPVAAPTAAVVSVRPQHQSAEPERVTERRSVDISAAAGRARQSAQPARGGLDVADSPLQGRPGAVSSDESILAAITGTALV